MTSRAGIPGLMLLVWSCWAVTAHATPAATRAWYVGLGYLDFGYKEFADDGRLLDQETGSLPGLVLGVEEVAGVWRYALNVTLHSNDVLYDGQTQNGTPVQTRTQEHIVDGHLDIGRRLGGGASSDYYAYAGLGYRYWYRGLRSTPSTNGYDETYDWIYGLFGVQAALRGSVRTQWLFDLRVTRTVAPRLEVALGAGYDNTQLQLGERSGLRLALGWRYHLAGRASVVVEPYVEQWDAGRSPAEALTRAGLATGAAIYEPRSETRNAGINLMYSRSF